MVCFQLGGEPDWPAIEAIGVWAGALATFLAFVTAFALQRRQFSEERRRERVRRAMVDVAVFDATLAANKLCDDARSSIQMVEKVDPTKVWEFIGKFNSRRRVLRHYLDAPIPLPELVGLATWAEQRMWEAVAAMRLLQKEPEPGTAEKQDAEREAHLAQARNQLQTVVDRARQNDPTMHDVKPKVDAERAILD